MITLYVTQPGTCIRRSGQRLIVARGEETVDTVRLRRVFSGGEALPGGWRASMRLVGHDPEHVGDALAQVVFALFAVTNVRTPGVINTGHGKGRHRITDRVHEPICPFRRESLVSVPLANFSSRLKPWQPSRLLVFGKTAVALPLLG